MRSLHRFGISAAAAVLLTLVSACAAGGGGGASAGDSCTQSQHQNDEQVCSGDQVLECKQDGDATDYVWKVDKDCAATGRVCSAGSCTEPSAATGGSDTTGGPTASCPSAAGQWTFTKHCDPEMVGEPFSVEQSGCDITVSQEGWSGSIDAAGKLTVSGNAGDTFMTCNGTVTETSLVADCTPTCHVEMTR